MNDIVDISWEKIDKKTSEFILHELNKCQSRGVPLTLTNTRTVLSKGFPCAGFFDDNPLEFAVAVGKSPRSWLPTFVHESCHLDQWIEQSEIWTRRINGRLPLDIFDEWLQHKIELDSHDLNLVIDALTEIELDCERRSIMKIQEFSLPIRQDTYIRKSNAYVYSYRIMQETRNWDHSSAYEYPVVWKRMPAHFDCDYSVLPTQIKQVFDLALEEMHR